MKNYSMKKIHCLRFVGLLLITCILLTTPVFASVNIGQNSGEWLLDQIFWFGLVIAACVALKYFLSGNFVRLGVTVVIAAVVLVIVDDPSRLKTLGEGIWNIANNASGGA